MAIYRPLIVNPTANQIQEIGDSDSLSVVTATVAGNLLFNSGYGSAATAYGCRAWVSFNAVTNTRLGFGNVSSITDYGEGNKGVNFTTNMPDTNYAVTSSARGGGNFAVTSTASKATNYVTIGIWAASGSTVFDRYNSPDVMVMVVR